MNVIPPPEDRPRLGPDGKRKYEQDQVKRNAAIEQTRGKLDALRNAVSQNRPQGADKLNAEQNETFQKALKPFAEQVILSFRNADTLHRNQTGMPAETTQYFEKIQKELFSSSAENNPGIKNLVEGIVDATEQTGDTNRELGALYNQLNPGTFDNEFQAIDDYILRFNASPAERFNGILNRMLGIQQNPDGTTRITGGVGKSIVEMVQRFGLSGDTATSIVLMIGQQVSSAFCSLLEGLRMINSSREARQFLIDTRWREALAHARDGADENQLKILNDPTQLAKARKDWIQRYTAYLNAANRDNIDTPPLFVTAAPQPTQQPQQSQQPVPALFATQTEPLPVQQGTPRDIPVDGDTIRIEHNQLTLVRSGGTLVFRPDNVDNQPVRIARLVRGTSTQNADVLVEFAWGSNNTFRIRLADVLSAMRNSRPVDPGQTGNGVAELRNQGRTIMLRNS